MKSDATQTIERLEAALLDTSGESPAKLRRELEADGVGVANFLSRLKGVVRKGYQHQMRLQGEQARDRAGATTGSIFGNLGALGGEELRALIARVLSGEFGPLAQSAARCRNYRGDQLTDEEIRSWLRDVEQLTSR